MPSKIAALIAKDPSQFKYWQKCGEDTYNGCLKWVDSRECCVECLLCQRCCQARAICGKAVENKVEPSTLVSAVAKAAIKAAVPKSPEPEGASMPIPGRMEITIKINEFPIDVKTLTNGWKEFIVDAGNHEISITVKPKVFAKLEQAQQQFPAWVAAIAGKIGKATEKGFILDDPNIQVFEKKPKAKETPAESATA
jgi:hypothetical protein